MTALLRYDAFGVSQILDNKPVVFNAQDGELVASGECDDVSWFPVADGELMDTEGLAGFGDEFVAVQHHQRVVRLSNCRRGALRGPSAVRLAHPAGTILLADSTGILFLAEGSMQAGKEG